MGKKKKETARSLLLRGQGLVDKNNDQAERALRRALDLADDAATRGACQDALGILARRTGDNDAAMTFFRQAIASHHGVNDDGEARSLVHLAGVELETSLRDEGIESLRAAFAIAKKSGNETLEAHVADVLSYALEIAGQHEEAKAIGERGLEIIEKTGELSQLGVSLGNKGVQLQLGGKLAEAEHHYQRALRASERAGDDHNAAMVLCNLGSLWVSQGRFLDAAPFIERGMALHQRTKNHSGAAHAALLMADIRSVQGDSLAAIALQREAIAKFHAAGNRYMEGIALGNMGNEEMTIGRLELALQHHQEAIGLLQRVKNETSEASVLVNQSLVFAEMGKIEEGTKAATRALEIFRDDGDKRWEGIAILSLGLIELLGDPEGSRATFERSLALLEGTDPSQTARVHLCLAALDLRAGSKEAATAHLARAKELAESAGDREGVRLAEILASTEKNPTRLGVTGRLLWKMLGSEGHD